MAADLETAVGPARADQLAARAVARAFSTPTRRRRSLVAALAGSSFALAGFTALGVFADGAAPGQILYPVDRVLESAADLVGATRDRSAERLEELIWVIDRGDHDAAVRFLPEVVVAVERSTGVTAPTPGAGSEGSTAVRAVEPAAAAEDPVAALKLAAEALLQGVRTAGTDEAVDLEAAATDLLLVAGRLESTPETAVAVETTSTTVDSSSIPEDTTTTTTTTIAEGGTTTTTILPEGGSTTTTTTPPPTGGDDPGGGGPGPIILPPLP